MKKLMTSVTMFLALTACATNPDPSQGGLMDGLAGLGDNGTYEQRIKERQARLDAIRTQKDAVLTERDDLDTIANARRSELDQLNQEYSTLHREIASMRSRLANMHLETKSKLQKRHTLEKQLSEVNTELGRLHREGRSGTTSIDKYKTEKIKLERRIDELALEIELLGR